MIRNPAPQPTPRSTPSRAPRRSRSVAKRDIPVAHKGKPRDIGRKADTVLDLAAVDPVTAARRCQAEISAARRGFREERRQHFADAYAIACGLENNPQAWRSFIDDDFWKKRKKKPSIEDRKAPLLHVMVFVFEAIDRTLYKRVEKYAAGLKQYLDRLCSRARGGGENQGGRRH